MLNIKELEEMGKKAGFSYVALLKSDSMQNAGAVLPDAEILKYAEKR